MRLCGVCALLTFLFIFPAVCADSALDALVKKVEKLSAEISTLTKSHKNEMNLMKQEIENLKTLKKGGEVGRKDEAASTQSSSAIDELKDVIEEIRSEVNFTLLCLRQNEDSHTAIDVSLSDLTYQSEEHRNELSKHSASLAMLSAEGQEMRHLLADLRSTVHKMKKELKVTALHLKENTEEQDVNMLEETNHRYQDETEKLRHSKHIRHMVFDISHQQKQIQRNQENILIQMNELEERLKKIEGPIELDYAGIKIDLHKLEKERQREQIANLTRRVSDFDKLHISMLELLENVQNIENKMDKTLPDFRKEISKLDLNMAQVNSQCAYLHEGQENIKQSLKAIAFSVSNVMEKASHEHEVLADVNNSVSELQTITKRHFSRLNDHILKSESKDAGFNDTDSEEITLPELMGEVKELEPVHKVYEDLINQLPRDCTNIVGIGQNIIKPGLIPIDTWCNNKTTLIQRRFNGSVEFNRKYAEYVAGFGDSTTEYWLGLENLHLLTADNCSSMRIDMVDIYGGGWYAEYDLFTVGSADYGYKLFVSGFKGNASDAFAYQNNMEFSTIDQDRDISNTHCASNYEGGWWFSHCQHVNINGKYSLGLTWFDSARNEWIAVASTEMTLSRKHCGDDSRFTSGTTG